jgi:hypothetical protein
MNVDFSVKGMWEHRSEGDTMYETDGMNYIDTNLWFCSGLGHEE